MRCCGIMGCLSRSASTRCSTGTRRCIRLSFPVVVLRGPDSLDVDLRALSYLFDMSRNM
jgi:hypothetical protein